MMWRFSQISIWQRKPERGNHDRMGMVVLHMGKDDVALLQKAISYLLFEQK